MEQISTSTVLYKKDSKDKLRSLEVFAEEDKVVQVSGLLEGKKVRNETQCKAKNVGRSNATTPEEQAVKQAEAKIESKLSEGYFKTLEEAENTVVIGPMLAEKYEAKAKKIVWKDGVWIQPKLDGMRCLGLKDNVLMSRGNKQLETLGHLHDDVNKLRKFIDSIPDGELYAHGLTFQENMRLIKKYRKGETEAVKYHVYDHISNASFAGRSTDIKEAIESLELTNIEFVPTHLVHSEEEMMALHHQFIAEGYEGTMIRWGDFGYEMRHRCDGLLKYKVFIDKQFKVLDIEPFEAKPDQGVVVLDGFKANMAMPHSIRREVLANKEEYIGQMAELRYFEETDGGLPRFPICVGFRLDK